MRERETERGRERERESGGGGGNKYILYLSEEIKLKPVIVNIKENSFKGFHFNCFNYYLYIDVT